MAATAVSQKICAHPYSVPPGINAVNVPKIHSFKISISFILIFFFFHFFPVFRFEFMGRLSKKPNSYKYRRLGRALGVRYIEHNGNCCIKIFYRRFHKGESQLLTRGFDGKPKFANIRSMKFGVCESKKENYWNSK